MSQIHPLANFNLFQPSFVQGFRGNIRHILSKDPVISVNCSYIYTPTPGSTSTHDSNATISYLIHGIHVEHFDTPCSGKNTSHCPTHPARPATPWLHCLTRIWNATCLIQLLLGRVSCYPPLETEALGNFAPKQQRSESASLTI